MSNEQTHVPRALKITLAGKQDTVHFLIHYLYVSITIVALF
jgi:hypothetical protein